MRRILISIASGVVIPIVFLLLLWVVVELGITFPSWFENAAMFIIQWPLIPLSKILQSPLALPGGDIPGDGIAAAWFGIHVLTFALLTYAVLTFRARRKYR